LKTLRPELASKTREFPACGEHRRAKGGSASPKTMPFANALKTTRSTFAQGKNVKVAGK